MDPYILVLVGVGVVVLFTAWLPLILVRLPLSLPMLCVLLGFVLFSLPGTGDAPTPTAYPELTERLTEFVVIVALMGAGLKLDRPVDRRTWAATWRLLGIAMPLSIVGIAVVGWAVVGLPLATTLLLAALLAPTDPVLAADVQVGPPGSGEEDEVRFALTSEAGLNNGLAFPFTNLAIAVALAASSPDDDWLLQWMAVDVLWKLAAGLAVGWAVGRGLAWVTFHIPNPARLSRTGDGFVALGMTCLSYGLTELAHGYGFLAVFVTAVVFRAAERSHAFHAKLHAFSDELERLLAMLLLVVFGGAIAGGLLAPLTWEAAAAGLVILLLVRPVAAWVSLAGSAHPLGERAVVAFFGIRGIGSLYYLAYALNHADFGPPEPIWALSGFVVLVSVVLHGTTVTPVMNRLDRNRAAPETAASGSPRGTPDPSAAAGVSHRGTDR